MLVAGAVYGCFLPRFSLFRSLGDRSIKTEILSQRAVKRTITAYHLFQWFGILLIIRERETETETERQRESERERESTVRRASIKTSP